MKHILIVTSSICRDGGGVSEAARLLAVSLSKQKEISVEVVTIRTRYFEIDKATWPNIPVRAYTFYGPLRYGFSPGLFLHILRSKPDLIHVHGLWMFHCAAVWFRHILSRCTYVVTPHGMLESWILARSTKLKTLIGWAYQDRFLENATGIQALTTKEVDDIRLSGVKNTNCTVVPNFVSSVESTTQRPAWWMESMTSRKVFLFFGRIHEKKGWKELCAAWRLICQRNKSFANSSFLVFCGWVDGSDDFVTRVSELSDELGNVVFAGPQHGEERRKSLSAADFFVLPSKSEGLPMVVLEAWAIGLPALLTSACNIDIGFERGAAFKTDANVADIASGLEMLYQMNSLSYERASTAAKLLIEDEFSEAPITDKILNFYKISIG